MSAEKPMTDQSILWNHTIHFWDVWGVRMMLAGAILGFFALAASLFSSFVLYRVASVAQSELETKTGALNVALETQEGKTATAQLETARIKGLVIWRSIDPTSYAMLVSALGHIKGSVTLAYVQNDPEALNFTILVQSAFTAANGEKNWQIASQPRMYTDRNVFGVSIFGKDEVTSEAVKAAFTAANIKFVEQPVPPPITQIGGIEMRVGEPNTDVVIMIGSRYPGL